MGIIEEFGGVGYFNLYIAMHWVCLFLIAVFLGIIAFRM